MARKVIKVNLELDRIHCHDEGDGWGSAEPYLWTVFFKVDGNTVQVTEALKLSGSPTTHNTPGSHGNLGDTDVDEGDNITIPSAIGEWETYLKPIPGPASLANLFEDMGGVIGVIAVLMEEDNVSNSGAEAGHQALNNAVRSAIQQIINTRSLSNQDVSEDELKGFTDAIQNKVKDAIIDQQNFFENLWSAINPDDTIGVKVFIFKHDDLDPAVDKNFSHRWHNEGDWELFGHITSTPLCPANALSGLFSRDVASEASVSGSMDAMRKFRDSDFRAMPGLGRWFDLAERHAGRVVRMALTQPELLTSARKMIEWGGMIATQPEAKLSAEHVEHAERLFNALAEHRNHQARVDARRVLSILNVLKGKTHAEAVKLLAEVAPARHPTVGGDPCARIQPHSRSEELTPKVKPEC